LSHKKVYDTFLASGYNSCLILEDDVKFSESFYVDVMTGNFGQFINNLRNTEYDVCFWGKSSSAIINNRQIAPFLFETKLCTYTWAAHAYQITRKCAEKLVANYFPIKYAADVFLEASDLRIVSPSYSYLLQHMGPVPIEEHYNMMVLLGTSPLYDKRKDWSDYVSLTNSWDTDNRKETDTNTDQFHRHVKKCTIQDNIPVKMITYEDKKHPNGMTTRNWATIHFDTN
jgi:GR25 family glycosyltransferase involved in LPS biosynthesis